MKKIALLGATGSIGSNTLDIVQNNPELFQISALTFNRNLEQGRRLIRTFQPAYVGVGDEQDARVLKQEFPTVQFGVGLEGLCEAAAWSDVDVTLVAVSGSVGLLPTLAAIRAGKTIALANKETLVMGGEIIMAEAQANQTTILPVDSEHSAIFQCLQGEAGENLKEIVITASGGSLRALTRAELKTVTIDQALNHPNWSMGQKITIDSATMVNKGLEVIEAHWLFALDYAKIKVVLHPESIVHSLIVLNDGAYLAQLGPSDMREPIQYALTYPRRLPIQQARHFSLSEIGELHFAPMSFERFPMLRLAYQVGAAGGAYPTVYNAANEVAVQAFLLKQIDYLTIEQLIERAVQQQNPVAGHSLEELLDVDRQTRSLVEQWIEKGV